MVEELALISSTSHTDLLWRHPLFPLLDEILQTLSSISYRCFPAQADRKCSKNRTFPTAILANNKVDKRTKFH